MRKLSPCPSLSLGRVKSGALLVILRRHHEVCHGQERRGRPRGAGAAHGPRSPARCRCVDGPRFAGRSAGARGDLDEALHKAKAPALRGLSMPLAGAVSNRHEGDSRDGSDNTFLVGAIGALLNHADNLTRLADLCARLLSQDVPFRAAQPVRLRSGAVQNAVVAVLEAANAAMHVQDVHLAVERHLSMRVSRDTVNSCLSVGARGEAARFKRVGRGCYKLRAS